MIVWITVVNLSRNNAKSFHTGNTIIKLFATIAVPGDHFQMKALLNLHAGVAFDIESPSVNKVYVESLLIPKCSGIPVS